MTAGRTGWGGLGAGVLSVAFWILGGAAAASGATLSLQISSVDWRGKTGDGYDVFDPTPYSQTVNFTVNKSGGACSYFVTFSKNTSGNNPRVMSGSGGSLSYQLYDTMSLNNVLKELPSASPTEVISGSFAGGTYSRQLSFVMAMPSLQIRPSGTYSGSVRVRLYEGTLSSYRLAQSVVISITARVPQLASVSLVSSSSGFDPQAITQLLSFGQLSDGQSRSFGMRVRSNAGYLVSLSSENRGVLKNQEPLASETIPYTLSIGTTPISLSAGPQVAVARRGVLTTVDGDSYSMAVVIGTVGNAAAGEYRDVVTITVQANN
jgi:hypothetical protein